jgi:hypothetical protein
MVLANRREETYQRPCALPSADGKLIGVRASGFIDALHGFVGFLGMPYKHDLSQRHFLP